MKTIEHYVSIAEASQVMLNAARASDWDALVNAEAECARRVAALRAHQQDSGITVDSGDESRRMNLLGEILARDAEIRELTTPWLKQLESFLTGTSRERRLGSTYRADFG